MNSTPQIERHIDSGETCCDPQWEAAYARFETPEEEVNKFLARLRGFGLDRQSKDQRIVELFCGRGGGLVALERLGFQNIEGIDLSEELLQQYRGVARLHLADCRKLPLQDNSVDAAIVQGGLHHLPTIPGDLESVLAEVGRILKPTGTFYVVEPWLTPFLSFVHLVVQNRFVRRIYGKGDALAEMIEHERVTYEQWLDAPDEIIAAFAQHLMIREKTMSWGKLRLVAAPKT